mmetsp:Transcript_23355/g.35863  ORF Transcript_23355/g.35863 Transcript_23355/m.35863 type:complete len:200 (-) Transcript_23355:119-718(-)
MQFTKQIFQNQNNKIQDIDIINMVTINWERVGNAGEEAVDYILNDFNGGSYCDGEIEDSIPTAQFDAFLSEHILPSCNKNWIPEPLVQRTMENGMGSGLANVKAWITEGGEDRLEYWTGAGGPANDDLDDDLTALLQTKEGHVLVLGVSVGHPFVGCDLFSFGNSDGSTNGELFAENAAGDLIRSMVARAKEYCYHQCH